MVAVRVRTKISMIYINDIYHDIYLIFSSENIMIYIDQRKYHDKYHDIFKIS